MSEARALTENQRNRRERILDAARELVAEHGYDGMIVRDVAIRAGVSPTTVYNLYNTKNELLLSALREKMAEGWDQPLEASGESGTTYLMNVLTTSVAQAREEPAYARAITDALMRAAPDDALVDVLIHALRSGLAGILKVMRERGELHDKTQIDPLSAALIGSFWSGYLLFSKALLDVDQLEAHLQSGFIALLLPASAPATRKHLERHLSDIESRTR